MIVSAPILLLVSGLPCTGKTYLAEMISERFSFVMFSKDGIKEILFDHFGCRDRAWSKHLSGVAYDILFHLASASLNVGKSVVLEANFSPGCIRLGLDKIHQRCNFRLLDVTCFTRSDILVERFEARARSGKRHPGHLDALLLNEIVALVESGENGRLNLECETLLIDTTEIERLDVGMVLASIEQKLWLSGGDHG